MDAKNFIAIFYFFYLISNSYSSAKEIKNCEWDNTNRLPCISISKTPNTSEYSEIGINKTVISKKEIENLGAVDVKDILNNIPGLDVFQSGTKGQTASLFTRGSESNHTLVMMNGIAINDQSVTDGLHDFGQDFIQNIQSIEIYKGSSGAHFGPSAIAGAINFITSIDYINNFTLTGFDKKNNSSSLNYSKITNNNWHLNFKSSVTLSETGSAIADGSEDDGSENLQLNINSKKWITDNLNFKSNIYSRKTVTNYDANSTDEIGYVSDNRMHTIQNTLEYISKKNETNLTFHYHNYDRQYEDAGYLDEYYSEAFVIRGESKNKFSKKISFGYGGEYRYDWGSFENRGSYNASTKGRISNLGIFGNIGYKLNKNSIISIYGRSDDHKTTERNQTYKLNFTKFIDKFEYGLTHSTGLRNPTLYELYGSDNYGITGNTNLSPEKSETNEFTLKYNFFKYLSFRSTAYRAKVSDQIETNSAYSKHENKLVNINQEGIENEILYKNNNEIFSFYNICSKSRNTNGQAQSRRPDLSFGLNYSRIKLPSIIGNINFNLNYKYTGKYIDWDGSKNSKQKSTDILNMSFTKNYLNNILYLKFTNLLNERYEKPATYSQDGRQFKIGFKKLF